MEPGDQLSKCSSLLIDFADKSGNGVFLGLPTTYNANGETTHAVDVSVGYLSPVDIDMTQGGWRVG